MHRFQVVVTCDKDKSTTTFVYNDWLRSDVRVGLRCCMGVHGDISTWMHGRKSCWSAHFCTHT